MVGNSIYFGSAFPITYTPASLCRSIEIQSKAIEATGGIKGELPSEGGIASFLKTELRNMF